MNKTEARALVRRELRRAGYFKGNRFDHNNDYVLCPLCRQRVALPVNRPAGWLSKDPTWGMISAAVVEHLTAADEDERCDAVTARED